MKIKVYAEFYKEYEIRDYKTIKEALDEAENLFLRERAGNSEFLEVE